MALVTGRGRASVVYTPLQRAQSPGPAVGAFATAATSASLLESQNDPLPTPVVRYTRLFEACTYIRTFLDAVLARGGDGGAAAGGGGVTPGGRGRATREPPAPIVWDVDATLVLSPAALTVGADTADRAERMVVPLGPVVSLLRDLITRYGADLSHHVVTARQDAADVEAYTRQQLGVLGIPESAIVSVRHAPEAVRIAGPVAISQWKDAQRRDIAASAGRKVLLSVGDQLTDHMRVGSMAYLRIATERLISADAPWMVLRLSVPHVQYGLLLGGPVR